MGTKRRRSRLAMKIIAKEVSKEVASELRDVWLLHFGSYVV